MTTIDQIITQLRCDLEAYGAWLREELEAEQAEHDAARDRLHQAERKLLAFKEIEKMLVQAEFGRMSDHDVVARIRGILHG